MKRLRLIALLAALPMAFGACSDSSAPEGRPGTLTVNAYVDRDASGSLTAADSVLSGVVVTVAANDSSGQPLTATTNAAGVATFADLPPASYRVSLASGMPAGAVLVTSPAPSAVIPFQGTAARVDFRFSFLPASLAGFVFRDDNANGAFDVSSDLTAAGVRVYLRRDSIDASGAPVAGARIDSTSTVAGGGYSFPRLAPGAYFVEFAGTTTLGFSSTGFTRVVFGGGQSGLANAPFTGAPITSVRVARASTVGRDVAISGTVTVPTGVFPGSAAGLSQIAVQDTSGGIVLVQVPTALNLAIGQRVTVLGALGGTGSVRTIGAPARGGAAPEITVNSGTTTPTLVTLTAAVAATLANEGNLVQVAGLVVDSIPTAAGTDSFTVFTTAATGGQTLRIFVSSAATGETRASFATGSRLRVSGILTSRNGQPAILPRVATDVTLEAGAPVPARVVINEIMPRPAFTSTGGSNDAFGEYFELYNPGTTPIDLQGYVIQDNSNNPDTIKVSLILPAKGYLLFAVSDDPALNGGLPTVDYKYKAGIALANAADRLTIRTPAGITADSVFYTAASFTAGTALGVIDANANNDVVAVGSAPGPNYAFQTSTFGSPVVARGTPRARNDGATGPLVISGARVTAPASTAAASKKATTTTTTAGGTR